MQLTVGGHTVHLEHWQARTRFWFHFWARLIMEMPRLAKAITSTTHITLRATP